MDPADTSICLAGQAMLTWATLSQATSSCFRVSTCVQGKSSARSSLSPQRTLRDDGGTWKTDEI